MANDIRTQITQLSPLSQQNSHKYYKIVYHTILCSQKDHYYRNTIKVMSENGIQHDPKFCESISRIFELIELIYRVIYKELPKVNQPYYAPHKPPHHSDVEGVIKLLESYLIEDPKIIFFHTKHY